MRRRADQRLFTRSEAEGEVGPGIQHHEIRPAYAGRIEWRCGESNPGPLRHQRRHLRAQPIASFGTQGPIGGWSCALAGVGLDPPVPAIPAGASPIATPGPGERGTLQTDGLHL